MAVSRSTVCSMPAAVRSDAGEDQPVAVVVADGATALLSGLGERVGWGEVVFFAAWAVRAGRRGARLVAVAFCAALPHTVEGGPDRQVAVGDVGLVGVGELQ